MHDQQGIGTGDDPDALVRTEIFARVEAEAATNGAKPFEPILFSCGLAAHGGPKRGVSRNAEPREGSFSFDEGGGLPKRLVGITSNDGSDFGGGFVSASVSASVSVSVSVSVSASVSASVSVVPVPVPVPVPAPASASEPAPGLGLGSPATPTGPLATNTATMNTHRIGATIGNAAHPR